MLSDWHVAIANGIDSNDSLRSSLLPNTPLIRFRRASGKVQQLSFGEVFSFTNSRKVSTPVHAQFGLLLSDIQELNEDRTTTPDGKLKQISSVLYNFKRNKPLLLIYEIEATHEGEDLFAERAVSFVVHFPNDTAFKTIKVTCD